MRNDHSHNESSIKETPAAVSDGGDTRDARSTPHAPKRETAPNRPAYTVSNTELLRFYFDNLTH